MKNDAELSPPPEASNPTASGVVPPVLTGGGPLSPRTKNLCGQQFGRLRVVAFAGYDKKGQANWFAKCACGTFRRVLGYHLSSGHTVSCGCYNKAQTSKRRRAKLLRRRFGRWTVVGFSHIGRGKKTYWRVRCSCGNERVVVGTSLVNGHSTSCGCALKDWCRRRKGDRHPCWNPTLTQEDRSRRRLGSKSKTHTYRLALRIRDRDNRTCLFCGRHFSRPGTLIVHHIEPWKLAPALRYDPANLVTLCRGCHDQFHWSYGRDAGLDELEDYLS